LSIIERAAGLLRSGAAGPQRQPAAASPAHGRDLVERAAANLVHHRTPAGTGDPAQVSETASGPARGLVGASREFKIDRKLLRSRGMITPDGGRTPIAESFRRIKRQILANVANPKAGAPPANLVMVTSALAGEGKSFCAINLALSMALEMDRTVLLVDADVPRASVPRVLGLNAETGLMEVLIDRRVDWADAVWKSDFGELSVLPAGAAQKHATELLASDAMRGLLRDMAERYHDRIIVFDSPPLLAASEAGALASQVGQIVVVVEANKTSQAVLKDALERVDADRVTGLLLNKVEGLRLEYGYDAYG